MTIFYNYVSLPEGKHLPHRFSFGITKSKQKLSKIMRLPWYSATFRQPKAAAYHLLWLWLGHVESL